jgi:hypothetical protein
MPVNANEGNECSIQFRKGFWSGEGGNGEKAMETVP